jgi:hypothetical protein
MNAYVRQGGQITLFEVHRDHPILCDNCCSHEDYNIPLSFVFLLDIWNP